MSEKTEKPTPKRLREARKKGQVAKSRTVGAVAGLAGGVIALTAASRSMGATLLAYTRHALEGASGAISPAKALVEAGDAMRSAVLPVMSAALGAVLVASAAQVGFNFRMEGVAPSFEKINPIAGIQRMWSPKSLIELLKAAITVVGVLAVAYAALKEAVRTIALTPGIGAPEAIQVATHCGVAVAKRALGVGLVMAALDYALQRRSFMKGLMMSKEEIKQEYKDSEGDPHVKGKRKRMARELASGTAKRGVKNATALVVNPTHIAVCLRYQPQECEAPTIVEKGVGERALRIRLQAEKLKVPVVRDIPLARTLVYLDVGDEIPEELYEAVAVVLKTAMDLRDEASKPAGPIDPGRKT
jgi:type III secretion protein U